MVNPLPSLKLAQPIGPGAVPPGAPFPRVQAEAQAEAAADAPRQRPGRPAIDSRRVVATRQDVHALGPLLAAAACAMGLCAATRRAFVADGSSENGSVYQRYCSGWTAVLDFLPALASV